MTTDNGIRGAMLRPTILVLILVGGSSWSIWNATSRDAPSTSGAITGPGALSSVAVGLVPAPRPTIEPEALSPAAPLLPAPTRVFTLPTDEYFESLSRPFTPPTLEDFKRAVEHKTNEAGLATALWQIPGVREAYVAHEQGFYMLCFVLGYYEREVMRASYNFASVPLATDLGDVGRFLLANAADPVAMRGALSNFESAVNVAVEVDNHEETYNSEEFSNIRDQLETQIRAVPVHVQALQFLRESIK
jgi:hypothetical protein